MPVQARHLIISGRVQGVFYRESMRMEADRLDVTGWVRNRRDGNVEAHVQGEAQAVQALIAWARVGPPAARVDSVSEISVEDEPFTEFQRLSTTD